MFGRLAFNSPRSGEAEHIAPVSPPRPAKPYPPNLIHKFFVEVALNGFQPVRGHHPFEQPVGEAGRFRYVGHNYSLLKLFTGLATAARMLWKLTVSNAIDTVTKAAPTNKPALRLT